MAERRAAYQQAFNAALEARLTSAFGIPYEDSDAQECTVKMLQKCTVLVTMLTSLTVLQLRLRWQCVKMLYWHRKEEAGQKPKTLQQLPLDRLGRFPFHGS